MANDLRGDSVWRMRKGASVAEATIITTGREREWQLTIDGETVIGCAYGSNGAEDQIGALARTARHELEARGWKPLRS